MLNIVTNVALERLIVTGMVYSVTVMFFRRVIVTEMLNIVTNAALERLIVTGMGYFVTVMFFRRVIVMEMLNIVTNAALERFIVTEMGYFVTVESLGVCCREEIRLLAIRCPRLGALQVVLEGVIVDNSTKLLNRPRS